MFRVRHNHRELRIDRLQPIICVYNNQSLSIGRQTFIADKLVIAKKEGGRIKKEKLAVSQDSQSFRAFFALLYLL